MQRNASLIPLLAGFAAMLCALTPPAHAMEGDSQGHISFDFATTLPAPVTMISPETSSGFEPGCGVTNSKGGGVNSSRPFFFSAHLPEGNYLVKAVFGSPENPTTYTVKAEARRLMVENAKTAAGQFITNSFAVNIRTVNYPGGKVRLKPRELTNEVVTWDDQLTLEFNGIHPVLRALEISSATNLTTVYLTGDSTVCDQPLEPWNSWGQMLPRFFDDHVAVANYAESGESLKSSLASHRFDKVYSLLKAGDLLFVQFGHNDMKDHATNAIEVYKSNLRQVVKDARTRGAIPVLVTSMERKTGVDKPTLAGYPDAVREIAHEEGTALIDLNAASVKLYRSLAANLGAAFQDGTHHNNFGSYEIARCVVEGIKTNHLVLADHLAGDVATFDPNHPDDPKMFKLPESPMKDNLKPEGN